MAKANKKKKNNSAKPAMQNAKQENVLDNNEAIENQPVETETVVEAEENSNVVENNNKVENSKKVAKDQPKKEDKKEKTKKDKPAKQSSPKQNKVKETVAELKKVTWPTFPKVVKNTLLVLVIVLISTAVLFGIDYVLSLLYKLLTPAA